jgi:hypothetical protein
VAAAVRAYAMGFGDQGIVEEMLSGIRDDSACRRGTLLCAPHVGALRDFVVAEAKLEANEANGWAACGGELPCWPLRTCPYSIVDESERAGKPKWRLTTDLSWPPPASMWADGAWVDSVNEGMDRSAWPANPLVTVAQFGEAAAILRGGGRRVRLWSLDGEAFYRALGRQRRELWRNGVVLERGVQLDERCCFGDASAAAKCTRVSNFVVHCVRRAIQAFDEHHPTQDAEWLAYGAERAAVGDDAELGWVGQYVDDMLAASADDLLFDEGGAPVMDEGGAQMRRAAAHFAIARAVLTELGWKSALSKEVPPCEELVALGVTVDLVGGEMRLERRKRLKYLERVQAAAAADWCEAAELERLHGRLLFAAQCYPVARQYLHAIRRVRRAAFRAGGRTRVTPALRRDLEAWAALLAVEDPAGVPLARGAAVSAADGAGVIYADASGEGGWAAWTLVGDEVWAAGDDWSAAERDGLRIEVKELLASTLGLVTFADGMPRHVVSFTDNVLAGAAMRSLSARSAPMQAVLARRTRWLFETERVEYVERVTSKGNVWADLGSRPELGGMAALEQRATAAGFGFRRLEVDAAWRDTTRLVAAEGEEGW